MLISFWIVVKSPSPDPTVLYRMEPLETVFIRSLLYAAIPFNVVGLVIEFEPVPEKRTYPFVEITTWFWFTVWYGNWKPVLTTWELSSPRVIETVPGWIKGTKKNKIILKYLFKLIYLF